MQFSFLLALTGSAVALVLRDPAITSNTLKCTPTASSASAGLDATAYCDCGNGFTQPIAPDTVSGSYNPCPPTQMTLATAAPTTVQQWAYTTTQSGVTIECQSTSWLEIDGATIAECGGSSQTIAPSKTPSISIDIISATSTYVGTVLSSTALSSAASSALSKLCAPQATTTPINCQGTISTGDIEYPDPDAELGRSTGSLDWTIAQGTFTDSDMMDKMFQAVGQALGRYANGTSGCKEVDFVIPELRGSPTTQKHLACFIPTQMIAQFFSGTNVYGADDFLVLDTAFEGAPGDEDVTNEVCEDAVVGTTILQDILKIFVPEAAPALAELNNVVKMACADAEAFKKVKDQVGKVTGQN